MGRDQSKRGGLAYLLLGRRLYSLNLLLLPGSTTDALMQRSSGLMRPCRGPGQSVPATCAALELHWCQTLAAHGNFYCHPLCRV